eukprot:CAMPEP_0201194660 /NCGR_PEP_ID=MMETSP0851-20130426/149533_1 /ASSEMBLY_ACC=CAM_ASM_000631 /TAXON_ID=183588 /ORGANISM="Pseudo-nitzschia fraudulenta, Strain WWA7" /LENGTH=362 /DNA_ID=CAMNT_0047481367 /DNA_START=83 /DNA_END=1169 /DNA_ORIENTATION=+
MMSTTTANEVSTPTSFKTATIMDLSQEQNKRESTFLNQRKPSVWMLVAILQSLFWLFGIPIFCRKYVWDHFFGFLVSLHPYWGNEIAYVTMSLYTPVFFLVSYNLVMIPIYAGGYPFFERYKIQQDVRWPWFDPRPKVRKEFWKLSFRSMKLAAFNLLVVVPFLLIVKVYVEKEVLQTLRPIVFGTDDDHWPSTSKNIQDIMTLTVIHEFLFFQAHKMMHSYPFLYQYHKVHHEYKMNNTLAAQHNHPVDYILSIAGPAVLSLALVPSSHTISQFQWILWLLWANLDDHVGYAFPWSPVRWFPGSASTDEHEFHHSKNMGCFGSKISVYGMLFGGYEHYDKARDSFEKKAAQKNKRNENDND